MQRISIISAMSENHVIGIHNSLPWQLPGDWENFRRVTAGKAFLMGRKSYEAADALHSEYRNVIISRQPGLQLGPNTEQGVSIEAGMALLAGEPDFFILGGAEIFRQTLHLANYFYRTLVHAVVEGDAFFPEVDWSQWELVSTARHEADARHAYAFSLEEWRRVV